MAVGPAPQPGDGQDYQAWLDSLRAQKAKELAAAQAQGTPQPQLPSQQPQSTTPAPQGGGSPLGTLGAYGAYKGISSLLSPSAFSGATAGTAGAGGTGAFSGSLAEATPGLENSSMVGAGSVANTLGVLAALHGGYNSYQNFGKGNAVSGAISGAETGAGLGTIIPGAGTLAGAGIGAVVGGLAGLIKNGKHPDQIQRDAVRKNLQQAGFIDQDWNIDLANSGGKFNIGLDGSNRPTTAGGRRAYETNSDNPYSTQAVAWANPLAEIITGGNDKLRSDFAGYLANAAMSDAQSMEGVRANVLGFMKKLGLDQPTIMKQLTAMHANGAITDNEFGAYQNALNVLISGDSKAYAMAAATTPQVPKATVPPVAPPVPGATTQLQKPTAPFNPSNLDPNKIDPGFNVGRTASRPISHIFGAR